MHHFGYKTEIFVNLYTFFPKYRKVIRQIVRCWTKLFARKTTRAKHDESRGRRQKPRQTIRRFATTEHMCDLYAICIPIYVFFLELQHYAISLGCFVNFLVNFNTQPGDYELWLLHLHSGEDQIVFMVRSNIFQTFLTTSNPICRKVS